MNLPQKIIYLKNNLIKDFIINLILLSLNFVIIYQLMQHTKIAQKEYSDGMYNLEVSKKKLALLEIDNFSKNKLNFSKTIKPCKMSSIIEEIAMELLANKTIYSPTISLSLKNTKFEGNTPINLYYIVIYFDSRDIKDIIETVIFIRSKLPNNAMLYSLKLNYQDIFHEHYKSTTFTKNTIKFVIKEVM